MGKIDESARLIIRKMYNKLQSKQMICKIYGLPSHIIDQYLLGYDQGTLIGREVIRMEIARVQAEKDGKAQWCASEMDKYKGGRLQ